MTEETARWRVFKARQKLMKVLAPEFCRPGATVGRAGSVSDRWVRAMNCQAIQNQDSRACRTRGSMPEPLREHVDGCRGVPRVVAAGGAAGALLEQLPPRPPRPTRRPPWFPAILRAANRSSTRPLAIPAQPRESRLFVFLRENAALVGGLAAAVLIAVGIWSIVPRGPKPEMTQSVPDDPFLKKMVQRDLASREG